MHQSGKAGQEIDRDVWWSSTDIDGAHIISAGCAEVLEVLEDRPPTWAEAALTAEQVTALLAPYHPGAAEAAAAWAAARLHVAHEAGGLAIRTPGPEYRRLGRIGRDYWAGNVHSKPYSVVTGGSEYSTREETLDSLPLDPVATAEATRR
jgi:hypothetical protein